MNLVDDQTLSPGKETKHDATHRYLVLLVRGLNSGDQLGFASEINSIMPYGARVVDACCAEGEGESQGGQVQSVIPR